LIDAGISGVQMEQRLAEHGVDPSDIDALLTQGDERKRMVVRGQPEALRLFIMQLSKELEVVSASEEFKQYTVVIVNREGSARIFEMAQSSGVQIRSYLPERFTLEDVFIDAVKEVRCWALTPSSTGLGRGRGASMPAASWSSPIASCGTASGPNGSWLS
jgi:hypothetical protein